MHAHDHPHTCKELLGSLSAYVDGDLGEELCRTIEQHMAGCENCRIVVDTLSKTVQLYHTTSGQDEAPSGVRERLFQTLKLDDLLNPGNTPA